MILPIFQLDFRWDLVGGFSVSVCEQLVRNWHLQYKTLYLQRDETDRTSYKEHCRPVQKIQGEQAVCVRLSAYGQVQ